MTTKFLFASGWKMNLTTSEVERYFDVFESSRLDLPDREVLFLPSFTALASTRERLQGTGIVWGAQDLHQNDRGAHTGEVSGRMLADLQCTYVMVGHAERRRDHGETDELVAAKLRAARRWGIIPILCVGDVVRGSVDDALAVIAGQLEALDECTSPTVVAYEPLWAIGSGTTASLDWIGPVHARIREWLDQHRPKFREAGRVVYGGSVSATTAPAIVTCPGVQGLFVGGASADPVAFHRMISLPLTSPADPAPVV